MSEDIDLQPSIRPLDILAGLGALSRAELCNLIVLLEAVDGLYMVKGAAKAAVAKTGYGGGNASDEVEKASHTLAASPISEAALRLRLWTRLVEALRIPERLPPFATRYAAKAAAAMAVRASERLSPSIQQRRAAEQRQAPKSALAELVGHKAAELWKAAKKIADKPGALSFPEIVQEEIINVFADADLIDEAARRADPGIEAALRRGHDAAVTAIAVGGGWAAFAAVVGNAGFLPYMLAAQASAYIPMVGGPALVSLLATLVNPVTVVVGVGAIGWLGLGHGASVVRSQVAARICVLLAISGAQKRDEGLDRYLGDMRVLDQIPSPDLSWMDPKHRAALRRRLSALRSRIGGGIPHPAIVPPGIWGQKLPAGDAGDALATAALTAGEMMWHAAAINPDVMKAADFSRSADLSDPISLALHAQDFALGGAAYSLRGYTAERLVLDSLVADGHDVALAKMSNTPGLDLMVDGMPVQVKCGTSISILEDHFSTYPDIPVIANAALAEKAAERGADWAHLVTTLPGFELDRIESQIAEALGHAADLADPGVLQFALSIGVLRGGLEVARGRVPVHDLPAWLLLDGASRGVLGLAGGKLGGWVGLVAIGPAGALVLGPAFGCAALLGNSSVKVAVQNRLMSEWMDRARTEAAALHGALLEAAERRILGLTARVDRLSEMAGPSDLSRWIVARAKDDLVGAIEGRLSLDHVRVSDERDFVQLLFLVTEIAPTDATVLAAAKGLRHRLAAKPTLHDVLLKKHGAAAADMFKSKFSRFRTETR